MMSSIIMIPKPRVCLNYTKLLLDPRCVSSAPLKKNLPFIFKVRELLHTRLFCTKGVGRPQAYNNKRDPDRQKGRIRQEPFFPTSVFTAGTAKRYREAMDRFSRVLPEEEERNPGTLVPRNFRKEARIPIETPQRPLTASEWRSMHARRPAAGSTESFATYMMFQLVSQRAELDVAKSLLSFVATDTGTLSYKLLLGYLTLCVKLGHHSEVVDLYDIFMARFGSVDNSAYTLFIKGFSQTERWRQTLDFLQGIKGLGLTPSPANYGVVIGAAVRHGDMGVAWEVHDEIIEKGLLLNQETLQSLFQGGVSQPGVEQQERLQGLLMYMRDNMIYPQESLAQTINTWFHSLPDQNWRGSWTTVEPRGVCGSCHEQLETLQLTEDEYGHLRETVMRDVIKGQDVFRNTMPEELQSFETFMKNRPRFDVVVDGLNIIYKHMNNPHNLLDVVCDLEQQGLVVLVLGRKHLRNFHYRTKYSLSQIQQKAHCFFADNLSADDPFLLYATLHSGFGCKFLSSDLMRDHKSCLPDAATRRLFFKWQRGHQLVFSGLRIKGRVQFQTIHSYDTIIQTSGSSWHIPYDEEGTERKSYEIPQRWLCLNKSH